MSLKLFTEAYSKKKYSNVDSLLRIFYISGHLIDKFRYVGLAPDPDSPNDLDPDALNMDPKH
jgi:hypothetical protein